MMTGAIDSLSTSIADGTAGFSDYLTALTSVAFALPMLIKGFKDTVKILKLDVVWKKASAGVTKLMGKLSLKAAKDNAKAATIEEGAEKKK
jgi:hypothetical protein